MTTTLTCRYCGGTNIREIVRLGPDEGQEQPPIPRRIAHPDPDAAVSAVSEEIRAVQAIESEMDLTPEEGQFVEALVCLDCGEFWQPGAAGDEPARRVARERRH